MLCCHRRRQGCRGPPAPILATPGRPPVVMLSLNAPNVHITCMHDTPGIAGPHDTPGTVAPVIHQEQLLQQCPCDADFGAGARAFQLPDSPAHHSRDPLPGGDYTSRAYSLCTADSSGPRPNGAAVPHHSGMLWGCSAYVTPTTEWCCSVQCDIQLWAAVPHVTLVPGVAGHGT